MKIVLSDRTINILKVFSGINSSIVLKPGKVLQTLAEDKSVYAEAEISEDFPYEVGISQLKDFIKLLTLQKKQVPLIEFGEEELIITQGQSSLKYVFEKPELINSPKGRPKKTDDLIAFELTWDHLKYILTLVTAMGFDQLCIRVENGEISFEAKDDTKRFGPASQFNNKLELSNGSINKDIRILMFFKIDNLKKLEHTDYVITLFNERRGMFKSDTGIEYHIVATKDSQIGKV